MDNSKGQTIFLSVIGIATLLVAIIGATFAWFSVTVTGNDEASNIIINTAVLGSVEFEDTSAINMSPIRPQTEVTEINQKEFTIAQLDAEATETLSYMIYLDVTTNNLSEVANLGTEQDQIWFHHSLEGTSNGSGTLVQFGKEYNGTKVAVPGVGTNNVLGTDVTAGTLVGQETHTYTYTIIFEESNTDQNSAQGKSFLGKLRVVLEDEVYSGAATDSTGA